MDHIGYWELNMGWLGARVEPYPTILFLAQVDCGLIPDTTWSPEFQQVKLQGPAVLSQVSPGIAGYSGKATH